MLTGSAMAQRVQIPATAPSTFAAPSQAPSAWGTQAGAYPAQGAVGAVGAVPPPAFDAYAPGVATPYGAPVGSPYTYTPPAGAAAPYSAAPYSAAPYSGAPAYTPYTPAPSAPGYGGWGNETAPYGWEKGTYGFESSPGTTVRFQQFLRQVRGEHTLLMGDGSSDAFELNRMELTSTLTFPVAGNIEAPLLVTPGFAFNWLDGPRSAEANVPGTVYDAYLDTAWYPRINTALGAELGFRTGVWSDFSNLDSDSLRLMGRGLGVLTVSPQMDFLLGVVYLDRIRVKMLPAGGVRWRPTPEWDLYLVFPNPKIRKRLQSVGGADWWWYLAAEYGGGSWTVERTAPAPRNDRFDYNDIRFVLGFEWESASQLRGHAEVGYVFDRELVFDSNSPERFEPDETIMFRLGLGF
ncbi:hypothetical protein Mal64_03770 [Pseudobythopirellula maris]|uniref:Uncharacterized protein n=1 Tax=Pseudobythopirellula maris TaxID=2527991 RepID=A0A5C5ZSG1_9BACT|nr:hypothetical protein [Pseudobythopirellula maris]TWT89995.1 hypothetical protein Mal64_03770 [Pseudobythopirellula maris]